MSDIAIPVVPAIGTEDKCECCPVHHDQIRRMEIRMRDLSVTIENLATQIGPALTMIGQPGGISSILFGRKTKG